MSSQDRHCESCKEEHGPAENEPILHGHVIFKESPATFRCANCNRKAYWNNGKQVPSLTRWIINKLTKDNKDD